MFLERFHCATKAHYVLDPGPPPEQGTAHLELVVEKAGVESQGHLSRVVHLSGVQTFMWRVFPLNDNHLN